jgi:streptogramin lyase
VGRVPRLHMACVNVLCLLTTQLPAQACESFPRSGSSSDATLVTAPDGAVWYADQQANLLMRVSPDRRSSGFAPNQQATGAVSTMSVAADGRVWYAKAGTGSVGYITATGAAGEEWPLPRASERVIRRWLPQSMIAAPDGAFWLIDPTRNSIARVTSSGAGEEFPVPTERSAGLLPSNIVRDRDGALWFASSGRDALYRFTSATGQFDRVALPGSRLQPKRIAIASDGAIWIAIRAQQDTGRLLRYDGTTFTEYAIGPGRADYLLADGAGGVWFSKVIYSSAGYITANGASASIACGAVGPLAFGPDRRPWSLAASMLILPASLAPSTQVVARGTPSADALRREAGTVEVVPSADLGARIRASRGTVYLHITSDDRGCPYCVRNVRTVVEFASLLRATAQVWEARWSPWRSAFDDPYIAGLKLRGMPTVLRFDDGVETRRITGLYTPAVMMDSLTAERSLKP